MTGKKTEEDGKMDWVLAFEKATSLTISIVFFPIIFLLAGIWLDKRFESTPLFIILGIIGGISLGVYVFIREGRKLKQNGSS